MLTKSGKQRFDVLSRGGGSDNRLQEFSEFRRQIAGRAIVCSSRLLVGLFHQPVEFGLQRRAIDVVAVEELPQRGESVPYIR